MICSEQNDELDIELDEIIRSAYASANQEYLRKQVVVALTASGKNREEINEWLNQAEISVS